MRNNTCFSRLQIVTNYENWDDISKISYKLFIKNPLGGLVLDDIYEDGCDEMRNCHCLNGYVDNNCTKLRVEPYLL